jgi:hypothetical protein
VQFLQGQKVTHSRRSGLVQKRQPASQVLSGITFLKH